MAILQSYVTFGIKSIQFNTPTLIYIHGGGWTLFSLNTHDRIMREYAARTGFIVVDVDYSLSPEYHIDPFRIAIGGDSAGANLCVATNL
ncbi:hypothetical protein I4U23_000192 [Adineta vaga]|nr:hypothetical protein I4U23_000192 [Adineta vaga]